MGEIVMADNAHFDDDVDEDDDGYDEDDDRVIRDDDADENLSKMFGTNCP